jgi:hypothetical protein
MRAWPSALVAKAKIAAVVGAAVAAGGLGGSLALSHVAPATHQVTEAASTAPASADPESTAAQDPESTATDPESSQAGDPESGQASDPESGDAQDPESGDAQDPGDCPGGAKNHGAYVSSVAHSAARGKGAGHGKAVSAAAHSDCGKKSTAGSDDPESGTATGSPGSSTRTSGHAKDKPGKPHADKPAKPQADDTTSSGGSTSGKAKHAPRDADAGTTTDKGDKGGQTDNGGHDGQGGQQHPHKH